MSIDIRSPEIIKQKMLAVYRYQSTHQVRSVKRSSGKIRFIKDTDWERGVFWSCVATAWKATGDQAYLDGVLNYTLHTGFRTGPIPRFADDIVCAQGYLDVYPEINQKEALEPTIKFLDTMVDDPKPGREDWWWCDSLFMAPPVFAALSRMTGDEKYVNYMHTAWKDSVEHLFDPETGLFYRDKRYIPDGKGGELREANGQKVFWSRGIGWVLAALPRILEHLPKESPEYANYVKTFTNLAEQVIKYQHDDGFWRASLLDPDNFPNPESSATALFCAGLAWGVAEGHLETATYLPVVEKAWQALLTAIHEDTGMIGWVQLPAYNPRDVTFDHNADYGAGAFLLAGASLLKLAATQA